MTNEEYFIELDNKIETLCDLRRRGIDIAKGITGEGLTKDDSMYSVLLKISRQNYFQIENVTSGQYYNSI